MESENRKEYIDHIYTTLQEKKITCLTDRELKKFAKRCLNGCDKYLQSINETDNEGLLGMKIDFLLLKLDNIIIQKIVKDETLRIKQILSTTLYETNDDLKIKQEELLSKTTNVSANSCSLYTCPRCKARDHTYREVMTRALDEPRSVKCVCQVCGFKFNVG